MAAVTHVCKCALQKRELAGCEDGKAMESIPWTRIRGTRVGFFVGTKKKTIHGLRRCRWRRHPRPAVADYVMAHTDDKIYTGDTKWRRRGRTEKSCEHAQHGLSMPSDNVAAGGKLFKARQWGTKCSGTEFRWQIASRMRQKSTRGRMCGEQFRMKEMDHPKTPPFLQHSKRLQCTHPVSKSSNNQSVHNASAPAVLLPVAQDQFQLPTRVPSSECLSMGAQHPAK